CWDNNAESPGQPAVCTENPPAGCSLTFQPPANLPAASDAALQRPKPPQGGASLAAINPLNQCVIIHVQIEPMMVEFQGHDAARPQDAYPLGTGAATGVFLQLWAGCLADDILYIFSSAAGAVGVVRQCRLSHRTGAGSTTGQQGDA